jgi:hypothetical protein
MPKQYFPANLGGSPRIIDRYMHENARRSYFQNMTEDEFRKHRQTTIDMEQAGYFKKEGSKVPKSKQKKYTLNEAKEKLKKQGRKGDTELEHVNKLEQYVLKKMGASRTTNPETGLTENNWWKPNPNPLGDRAPTIPTPKIIPPKIIKEDFNLNTDQVKGSFHDNNLLPTLDNFVDNLGSFATSAWRDGVVGTVSTILGADNPYNQNSSTDDVGTVTNQSSTSTSQSGFGAYKRKKKKKKLGTPEEQNQQSIASTGKRNLRVTKKQGLSIPTRSGLNTGYGTGLAIG